MMGKILWRHAQKKNCECVDMHKKLLPRHQKVLEDFYEDYAPHSQHKVPGLLKKYSNKGNVQFAMLMYTLHKKYPKSYHVHTLTAEEKKAEQIRKKEHGEGIQK